MVLRPAEANAARVVQVGWGWPLGGGLSDQERAAKGREMDAPVATVT